MDQNPPNCTDFRRIISPADVPPWVPDPDISGLGIIIAATITAALTIILSVVFWFLDWLQRLSEDFLKQALDDRLADLKKAKQGPWWRGVFGKLSIGCRVNQKMLGIWRQPIRSVIIGLSDQQLLTGLIQMCVAYGQHRTIHFGDFAVAVDIVRFSLVTHAATLFVLRASVQAEGGPEPPVERSWILEFFLYNALWKFRVFLVLSTFVLQVVGLTQVYQARSITFGKSIVGYPMHCFWDLPFGERGSVSTPAIYNTVVLLAWLYLTAIISVLVYRKDTMRARAAITYWPLKEPSGYKRSLVRQWSKESRPIADEGWGFPLRRRMINLGRRYLVVRTRHRWAFFPLDLLLRLLLELLFPRRIIIIPLVYLWFAGIFIQSLDISLVEIDYSRLGEPVWKYGQVFAIAIIGLPFMTYFEAYAERSNRDYSWWSGWRILDGYRQSLAELRTDLERARQAVEAGPQQVTPALIYPKRTTQELEDLDIGEEKTVSKSINAWCEACDQLLGEGPVQVVSA